MVTDDRIVCSLCVVTDVDRNVNQVNKSDLNAQRVVTSLTAQAVSFENMLNKFSISKSRVYIQLLQIT